MSRYEDDYSRGRSSHHHRDHTHSSDTTEQAPDPDAEALVPYEGPPSVASPGYTTYNGNPIQGYPRTSATNLLQESRSRPRSLPPSSEYRRSVRDSRKKRSSHGGRYSGSGSEDSDFDENRARSPVQKARHFVDNAFTDSATGLGVGVLGALVGGLAGREAAEAAGRYNSSSKDRRGGHHRRHRSDEDDDRRKRTQLISTVVGAAVGALGANAVEKRIEANRAHDRAKQDRWERKWRPEGSDRDVVEEKREVVARPRSTTGAGGRGGGGGDWEGPWGDRDGGGGAASSRGHGGRGIEREVDTGARSWRNVEDWLNDERDEYRPPPPQESDQRSADRYRY
ncbi:hypothetical protein F5B20DRAFT_555394 [Whalleya microplaca]|nr:hypothetical protein F5B20DRAFT_555394 [Whalleya microplaca]